MALEIDLIYVLIFSILGGVLAARFKQPSVLGVLIAGAIVGPNALGLIKNVDVLEVVIEIGAILLLFLVGVEFSVEKLLNLGIRAIIITVIKLGIVFFVGHAIAVLFGLDGITALAIAFILSITSTVIFLKILEQKGLSDRPEINLLISVLILEDIYGVFALTFFSSLASQAEITPLIIITKLVISLALLGIAYFVLLKLLKPTINWLSKYSTQDTITFIAIGTCAGMAYIAHLIGLSPAVGAFLAGNIISSLRNAEIFEKAIHPFILTFTSLFFFSIGTIVDFTAVFDYIWLIIALFAANVIFKFLAIGFSSYLFSNFDGKSAVFSGLAMVSLGEFSLLIAKESNILNLGIDLVSITAIIIFFSSLTMSLLITHERAISNLFARMLPRGIKYDMRAASNYIRCLSLGSILSDFKRRKIFLESRSIYNNVLGMLFVVFVVVVWYNTTQFRFISNVLHREFALWIIIGIAAVVLVLPTFNVIRNFRNLVFDLFSSFIKLYPDEIVNEKKIFRNVIFVIILFIASLLIPAIVSILGLNPRLSGISVVLIMVLLFLLTKSEKMIYLILKRNKKMFDNYKRKFEK